MVISYISISRKNVSQEVLYRRCELVSWSGHNIKETIGNYRWCRMLEGNIITLLTHDVEGNIALPTHDVEDNITLPTRNKEGNITLPTHNIEEGIQSIYRLVNVHRTYRKL